MTTRAQASAALEKMRETLDVASLIGVPTAQSSGPLWARSIGVSASGTDYRDHFIEIRVPTMTDVSLIPADFDGVRIVVELVDQPGAVGYAPDPRLGPRQ